MLYFTVFLRIVHGRLHIHPLCGLFYSKKHWQSGVNRIANVPKGSQRYLNPGSSDHQSRALATELSSAASMQITLPVTLSQSIGSQYADYAPRNAVTKQHCLGRRQNVALRLDARYCSCHVMQCHCSYKSPALATHSGERLFMLLLSTADRRCSPQRYRHQTLSPVGAKCLITHFLLRLSSALSITLHRRAQVFEIIHFRHLFSLHSHCAVILPIVQTHIPSFSSSLSFFFSL